MLLNSVMFSFLLLVATTWKQRLSRLSSWLLTCLLSSCVQQETILYRSEGVGGERQPSVPLKETSDGTQTSSSSP